MHSILKCRALIMLPRQGGEYESEEQLAKLKSGSATMKLKSTWTIWCAIPLHESTRSNSFGFPDTASKPSWAEGGRGCVLRV